MPRRTGRWKRAAGSHEAQVGRPGRSWTCEPFQALLVPTVPEAFGKTLRLCHKVAAFVS